MKAANCARCGTRITVPNWFDIGEDMQVCPECDEELDLLWQEAQDRRRIEDTKPL